MNKTQKVLIGIAVAVLAAYAFGSALIKAAVKPNEQIVQEAEYAYYKEAMKTDTILEEYLKDRGAKYSSVKEVLNDLKVHPMQAEDADVYSSLTEKDEEILERLLYQNHIASMKMDDMKIIKHKYGKK